MERTLLIVDDVQINREILKKILAGEYAVLEADNGEKALAVMQEHYQDLSGVLLDLGMPVMDGFAVLETMRKDPHLKNVPVLVATGQTEEKSEERALQLGANDYISKPYNPTIIKQRLRNVINLRETSAVINEFRHDHLTGLYSRAAFFEKATSMIAAKPAGYYVIACFDINHFKIINDQYGTAKGDQVLCFIADTFKNGFDKMGGICSRIMADNFAALYPRKYMKLPLLNQLAQKAAKLDGTMEPLAFSIGRYVIDDKSLTVSAMYDRAVMAETLIKGRFDENVAVFDESMRNNLLKEQKIVGEMRHALADRQFETWFQPQYNHITGSLIGAEVLVRWKHPEQGVISPGIFIPIFEKNGFIYEVDKYIWEQSCICLRKWLDEGRNPLPLSINISRYDVYRNDLMDVMDNLIMKYRIPPELLRLEITESAFSENTKPVIQVVKQFIARGFTVEIDDFGSGFSSLNILKDLPAQIIKLDMKFLETAEESQRGGNIIESIVRMAKWLGMAVIAEGVETKKQADFLKSIGCFYIQGYLYAKPLNREEYERLTACGCKQRNIIALETVENLDNNALWNPDSMDTLIFNSYIGGACIYEYNEGQVELLRANDNYLKVLESKTMGLAELLNLDWSKYLDENSRQKMAEVVRDSAKTGEEHVTEFTLLNLPGCVAKTYLRVTLRVIATAGARCLIYSTNENITKQILAEQKRQETTEQLLFLDGVAHELLTQTDTNAALQAMLGKLLTFFGGERGHIFELDFDKKTLNNTYEECGEGIAPQQKELQNISVDIMYFELSGFSQGNYHVIPSVDALPDARPEKPILLEKGVHTLLTIALKRAGRTIGLIGVDNPSQKLEQAESLTALGDYIAAMLTRRDMDETIQKKSL